MNCIYCSQPLTADEHGVLVDSTGGDVCGSYGTYTNEPHVIDTHQELIDAQEAAYDVLKAAAPIEHEAHRAAVAHMLEVQSTPESVAAAKAAGDAWFAAAPAEAEAYTTAVFAEIAWTNEHWQDDADDRS